MGLLTDPEQMLRMLHVVSVSVCCRAAHVGCLECSGSDTRWSLEFGKGVEQGWEGMDALRHDQTGVWMSCKCMKSKGISLSLSYFPLTPLPICHSFPLLSHYFLVIVLYRP